MSPSGLFLMRSCQPHHSTLFWVRLNLQNLVCVLVQGQIVFCYFLLLDIATQLGTVNAYPVFLGRIGLLAMGSRAQYAGNVIYHSKNTS